MLQNKIDLVKESEAKEQHEQILKFVQGLPLPALIPVVAKNECTILTKWLLFDWFTQVPSPKERLLSPSQRSSSII